MTEVEIKAQIKLIEGLLKHCEQTVKSRIFLNKLKDKLKKKLNDTGTT
jgi:hypothetical protein